MPVRNHIDPSYFPTMGVTVLHPYPLPENKTGAQTIETLTKRILAVSRENTFLKNIPLNIFSLLFQNAGASLAGQFLVDCESYTTIMEPGPPKTVHMLHNSENPVSVFSILDTGSKQIPLIADGLFDLLMMRITNFHSSKKQTKIESKGPRFEVGDFVIKLGSVTLAQNFKGILIEVEYRPCFVASLCWELIREFLVGILNLPIPKALPAYFSVPNRPMDVYNPIDTIQQYLEHFTNYRKQTGPAKFV